MICYGTDGRGSTLDRIRNSSPSHVQTRSGKHPAFNLTGTGYFFFGEGELKSDTDPSSSQCRDLESSDILSWHVLPTGQNPAHSTIS